MKRSVMIVGGGASGMSAGISAARAGAAVMILEHTNRPGKKLLSTGNGKCNLTNQVMPENAYRGGGPEFINTVLGSVNVEYTLDFFRRLGLVLTDRNGYVYPNSGQASSVLDALRFELEYLGVPIVTNCQVEEIKRDLTLITSAGKKKADAVIVAAGSMAAPKTGSDGSGYKLLKNLGHHIVKPGPALVQLKCREKWYKQAAGVRTEGVVTLIADGTVLCSDRGEVQFTDYGVSGIPVFQVSRFAVNALSEGKRTEIILDLFPSMDFSELKDFLLTRTKVLGYRPTGEFLNGVLNKKLSPVLLKESGIKTDWAGKLTASQVERLAAVMKGLKSEITGSNSFDQAQVCSGGADTREINPKTMESRLVKGLYVAGEIIDVDGICGGYNLQWAWSSGILAGICAGGGTL